MRTSSKCIASFLQIPQSSIIVVRVKPDVVIIMYYANLKKSVNILKEDKKEKYLSYNNCCELLLCKQKQERKRYNINVYNPMTQSCKKNVIKFA